MGGKRKVLFVCGRNAARSQMAEGYLRALYGDLYQASSAGLRPSVVSRTAIRVMGEEGIDISSHRSKSLSEFSGGPQDLVVTLCDEASSLPAGLLPPAGRYLHRSFSDPVSFTGNEGEVLAAYRDVRDRIGDWIREEFGPGAAPGEGTRSGPLHPSDLQKT
ncbi:MAG: arsenate reductase ArsC [Methanomicrobiales archaeon]|nr:arsenate reductase ArsC [Methanomicrobiales archaeon]